MSNLILETMLLDEQNEVSFQELADLSGFFIVELRLLVESGALIPTNLSEDSWVLAVITSFQFGHYRD